MRQLVEDLQAATDRLQDLCGRLSNLRRALAVQFSEAVGSELRDLLKQQMIEILRAPRGAAATPQVSPKVTFLVGVNGTGKTTMDFTSGTDKNRFPIRVVRAIRGQNSFLTTKGTKKITPVLFSVSFVFFVVKQHQPQTNP